MTRVGGELCDANRRDTTDPVFGVFIAEGGPAVGSERLTGLVNFLEKRLAEQRAIGNIRRSTV